MEELRRHLPIELSERRVLRAVQPEDGQLVLELKQIALYESFRSWASEEEVQQEIKAVASPQWLRRVLQDPDYLLIGVWQNRHLQALGAMQRKGDQLRVMSGFAWPTGLGLAGPMMKTGVRLGRMAGEERLWAFSARDNLIGKSFLESHGFRYAGSMWKLNRPPHWVMVDYVLDL